MAGPPTLSAAELAKTRADIPGEARRRRLLDDYYAARTAEFEKIEAPLLLINAADDERNPPETGITEAAMKRVKNGKLLLIPASEQTSGHATTGNARFYKQSLQELLDSAPQKEM